MRRLSFAVFFLIVPFNLFAQTTIFFEDFEGTGTETYTANTTGLTGAPEWDYENTNPGIGRLRVNAGTGFAKSGTKAATLDVNTDINPNVNYLILNLDLSAYTSSDTVLLDFSYMDHGEEIHGNDSVWIRGNNGAPWVGLYDLFANKASAGTYRNVNALYISTALVNAGQAFSATFQIRFGQEDNFPATSTTISDGFTFDDIHLYYPSVIFSENFESFSVPSTLQNGWVNATGDDMDWSVNAGPTGSGNTGPDVDFTFGTSAGKYLYLEATSNFPDKTALLTTPFVDVSNHNNVLLEFYYHMYGVTMGKLIIEASGNGTDWSTIGYISGEKHLDQLAPWFRKRIVLPANADSVQIRFRGVTGSGFTSDLSIDNITMYGYSEVLTGLYTYGGSSNEEGESIVQTPEGDFILAGYTSSYGGGNRDIYLVKTNSRGLKIWSKTFGGTLSEEGFELVLTKDGGIVIAGRTASYGSGLLNDACLIKTDMDGNLLWMKTYGNAGPDYGMSLRETSDGGFIIGGYGDSGGQDKFLLIRTDSVGDTLWTQYMDAGNKEKAAAVEQVRDGGFIVMGSRSNTFQAYMIKVDADGVFQWANSVDGPDAESWSGMIQSPDDGYYVIGGTRSNGQGNSDIHLTKIDEAGNLIWTKVYGGNGWDMATDVQLTNDGKIIIAGRDGSFGVGAGDSFMMKVDLLGNIIWSKTYGGTGSDWATAVVPCIDGGYALTGYTESFGNGGKDMFLIKTDEFGNIGCYSTSAPWVGNQSQITNISRSPSTLLGLSGINLVPGESVPDNDLTEVCTPSSNATLDTITFQVAFGSLQNDETGNEDYAESCVVQTSDLGYAIIGTSAGFGTGGKAFYLSKFDRTGVLQWSKAYGGADVEQGYSLRQTSDKGFILAGRTKSFGLGADNMYVVRTDEFGDTLWTKTYGGSGSDRAHSIRQTSDGGYIIVGHSVSYGDGAFIVKTDGVGDTVWTKTVVVGTKSEAYTVEQTVDGGYIVGGYSNVCSDQTPLLIKLSSTGIIEWIKSYEGDCISAGIEDVCYAVRQTSDGGFIMVGEMESFGQGGTDGFLIKTDEVGDTLWTRTLGTTSTDRLQGIEQTSDGGYIIAGHTNGFGSTYDMHLTKTNSAGEIMWSKVYGGNSNDRAYAVKSSADGGYILGGFTESFDIGNGDIYLVKTDDLGVPGNCFYSDVSPVNQSTDVNVVTPVYTESFGNTSFTTTADVDNASSIVSQLDLQSTIEVVGIGCNGSSDGSVDLTLNGGTTPLTFLWSSGPDTEDLTNINAGTYIVTVTDDNGCVVNDTAIVTEPVLLTTGIASTDISCYGGNNGTASAIPAGGTLPYNYMWNTGQTDSTAFGLFPGNYSVNVFDLNGCLANNIITLTEPGALTTTIVGTDAICIGGSTGAADLTPSGGTPPYTFLWSNAATTEDISGISAGTYTVTLTDSCNAVIIDSFVVNEPPAMITSIGKTDISCNGAINGVVDLSITGGTLPYSYLWSNAETTQDIFGLDTGTFSVIITDSCGINAYDTIIITQPDMLSKTISKTDVTCNSGVNGTATVTLTGGTTPYIYLWNNGQTSSTAVNLFVGNYTVSLSDANGCTTSATVTVNQPAPLSGSITGSTNVTCNADNDGTVTLTHSGGTTPYTYLWSNSATTQNISSLVAGTYTVTVTDSCSATFSDNVTITEPTALTENILVTDISCFGDSNGIADLTVSGGTSPYTYLWSNAATTEDISGLAPGNYSVIINDACITLNDTVLIVEPATFEVSLSKTDVTCNNGVNGTATATASGGTAPYNYLWNNGQTSSTAVNLFVGNYTVSLSDANGCTASATITVSQPSPVSGSITSSTDVSCNGNSTGAIILNISNGTTPYTFLWSNGASVQNISTLAAGMYSVTATDACSNSFSDSVEITEPNPLTSTIASTDASCNGYADGLANLSVSGGTTPYTYSWSSGPSTQDINNLDTGMYIVTITDACTATLNDTAIISQPQILTTIMTSTDVDCFGGGNGTGTVTVAGGTPPYNYLWNNGQTNATSIGLFPNSYTVNVTDSNGCLTTDIVSISQPAQLMAIFSSTDVSCLVGNDGTGSAMASGGTLPYSYLWSITGDTTATSTNLVEGTYAVTITDSCGTTIIDSVVVGGPGSLSTSLTGSNVSCFGFTDGSITLSVASGSTPYSYLWSTGDTTKDISGLILGTYTVTVTDSCGTNVMDSLVITEPTVLTTVISGTDVNCFGTGDGTAMVVPAGGTTPYFYLWNNGQSSATMIGLFPATYTVNVTDLNGCLASDIITIAQPAQLSESMSSTDASCSVGNDGTATITHAGGTGPYTYIWSPSGDTLATATNLVQGTYTVTVSDSCGVSLIDSVVVGGPGSLSASLTGIDVSCSGFVDGSINLTVLSGIPPYSFLWSNGDTTEDISGLSIGTFSVTVTDSCGTIIIDSLSISEPILLTTTISGTNINCNGNGDGTATITASGGTPPYFYQWNNNQTVPAMIGLFAGSYTVNVTDNNGCLTSNSIVITEPPMLTLAISILDASCGNADGIASVTVGGGVIPYGYVWSSGGTSSTDTALVGGTYSVLVTDTNGCMDSSTVTIPISAVPQEICMVTVDSTSSMNVVVWGKTQVSNIDSFKIYRDVVGVYAHIGSLEYGAVSNYYDSTIGINPNITSYRYKMSVLDVCGNESVLSNHHETIHVQTNKIGGIVDLSWDNYEGFGFAYYRILRDSTGLGGANWMAFDSVTSNNLTYTDIDPPTATTNYAIEVVHTDTCLAEKVKNWNSSKSNTSTTIGTGGSLSATTSSTNSSFGGCDGTATITPTSGTPAYTYLWDGSTGFQNTATAAGLCPGTYSVTVTDAGGATYSTSVAVGEDAGTTLSASTTSNSANADTCDGSATVTAAGGFPPYTYLWDGNAGNQDSTTATGLCPGTYSVVVTDSVGNDVTVFATIGVFPGLEDLVEESVRFNAYPNPFTRITNVSYTLTGPHQVRLELYNILGESIHTVENDEQGAGEYVHQINAAALNMTPGVYHIRLTLDNNMTFTKQLIELN